jgi:hypothetical protein
MMDTNQATPDRYVSSTGAVIERIAIDECICKTRATPDECCFAAVHFERPRFEDVIDARD